MNQRRAVFLAFFTSGATALVLEVVWSKYISYLLGSSLYSAATVVASYMLGLSLGSYLVSKDFLKRFPPLRTYGVVQCLVGFYSLLSLFVLSGTSPLFSFIYNNFSIHLESFLFLRFLVLFLLITLPVTLMGMTLPLLTSHFENLSDSYDLMAAKLYATNTFGAVVGTLAGCYILIPSLGLRGTSYAVGLVDFIVGITVLCLTRNQIYRDQKISLTTNNRAQRTALDLKGFIFAFGILAMIFEVAWFRYLSNVLGGSVHAFSNVLAAYLIALAAGSSFVSKFLNRTKNHYALLVSLLVFMGFTAIITLYFYNGLPLFYADLFQFFGKGQNPLAIFMAQFVFSAVVVVPTTFFMGAVFPALLAIYRIEVLKEGATRGVGLIYAFNTFGNIVGTLAGGFLILPRIGFFNAIAASAVCCTLLGILFVFRDKSMPRSKQGALAATLLGVTALLVFRLPQMDLLFLNQGFFNLVTSAKQIEKIRNATDNSSQLVFYEEGINVSVAIIGNEYGSGGLGLRVSSKGEAHTSLLGRRHLLMLGQLPLMFAKNVSDVAVIGFGGGMTAGSVLTHEAVKSMDVLEFEPGVIHASKYFDPVNNRPLDEARTNLILEDGRIHLSYTNKQYDVITTDPISPWLAGSANLYSQDFYEIAAHKLKPGGVFCQWVQLGDFTENSFKMILASLRSKFKDVSVFIYSYDAVVLASNEKVEISWEEFQKRFSQLRVKADFTENNIKTPFQLLSYFFAGTEQVDKYLANFQQFNTDDNVWLEHHLPFELYSNDGKLHKTVAAEFVAGRFAGLNGRVKGVPPEPMTRFILQNYQDEFTDVPDTVFADVNSYFSGKPSPGNIGTWFAERQSLLQKNEAYAKLWQDFDTADQANKTDAKIRILQKLVQQPIARNYSRAAVLLSDLYIKQGSIEEAKVQIAELKRQWPVLKDVDELENRIINVSR